MNTSEHMPPVSEVGEADFEAEVLRSKRPVIVAFCAEWSRPCQILEWELDQVAVACAPTARVVRVNADDNPDLSLWCDIQSIPTLLFFVDGSPRDKAVGTISREAILAKLRAVCDAASLRSSGFQAGFGQ
jgi:thioredoxin-like negative regulator of GroEL